MTNEPSLVQRVLRYLSEHPEGSSGSLLADVLHSKKKSTHSTLAYLLNRKRVRAKSDPMARKKTDFIYFALEHFPSNYPQTFEAVKDQQERKSRKALRLAEDRFVDSSSAIFTRLPGFDPNAPAPPPPPVFSSLHIGKYLDDETWSSRAYGA
jgi:hypothetical protein